jgi:cytoskeleton protein RodZ
MTADRTPGDFGTTLREARERKGVTLRHIANATKISVAALEALERNNISRLPGGIFSRAFVRSYAIEVGLDPETTIQDFIAQFPNDSVTQGHPTSSHVEDHEELESDRRMATTFLWILAASIPIAGGLLYLGTSSRRAPKAATASTRASAPRSEAAPPVEAPGSAAAADPVQAAAAVPDPPPLPPPPIAAPVQDHLTVVLSAKRPVWVSATVDGQKAIERLVQAGEKQTIEVKRELVMTAGDAAAVSLTLNGADARALGKSGEVVTTRLTLNNFKDYVLVR